MWRDTDRGARKKSDLRGDWGTRHDCLERAAARTEPGLIFGAQRWFDDFKAAVAACELPKETAP
jgi:hypothetical protein